MMTRIWETASTILANFIKLVDDGGPYHIETSAKQIVQSKSMDWFLYDRDLRHKRVKLKVNRKSQNVS